MGHPFFRASAISTAERTLTVLAEMPASASTGRLASSPSVHREADGGLRAAGREALGQCLAAPSPRRCSRSVHRFSTISTSFSLAAKVAPARIWSPSI